MLSQAFAKAKAAHGASVVLDDEEPEPARPLADDDGVGISVENPEPLPATGGPLASSSAGEEEPPGLSAAEAEEEPAPEAPAAMSKQVIEARRNSKGARVVTKPRG